MTREVRFKVPLQGVSGDGKLLTRAEYWRRSKFTARRMVAVVRRLEAGETAKAIATHFLQKDPSGPQTALTPGRIDAAIQDIYKIRRQWDTMPALWKEQANKLSLGAHKASGDSPVPDLAHLKPPNLAREQPERSKFGVVLRTRIVHHFGDQTGFNESQHLVPAKAVRGAKKLHDRAVLTLEVDTKSADIGCFLVGSDDVRHHASQVKSLELVAEGGAEIAALAKSLRAWLAVLEG